MDFFADGGFQQLFCDLNEQIEQDFNSWQPSFSKDSDPTECESSSVSVSASASASASDNNNNYFYTNSRILDYPSPHESTTTCPTTNNYQPQIIDLNEKQLNNSFEYLLNNSTETLEEYDLATFSSSWSKDLCDWEDKFLDNYIEIPELVDILPEKTPLCNDNCNHFLQESAENLKILPSSPPSSPDVAEKSYPCTYGDCQKIYAKPAHLKAHLRRHMGEKPYICNWTNCTWRFSRSDELARHRRSHSGVKPYKCDFCAKCFARSDHLTKHRKVHERRLLAATKAGKNLLNGELPASVLTVRPGRKRKNQL